VNLVALSNPCPPFVFEAAQGNTFHCMSCIGCANSINRKHTFPSNSHLFLFSETGKAFIDLIVQYGWESITILYENNDSMMRLKEIFDITSEVIEI